MQIPENPTPTGVRIIKPGSLRLVTYRAVCPSCHCEFEWEWRGNSFLFMQARRTCPTAGCGTAVIGQEVSQC